MGRTSIFFQRSEPAVENGKNETRDDQTSRTITNHSFNSSNSTSSNDDIDGRPPNNARSKYSKNVVGDIDTTKGATTTRVSLFAATRATIQEKQLKRAIKTAAKVAERKERTKSSNLFQDKRASNILAREVRQSSSFNFKKSSYSEDLLRLSINASSLHAAVEETQQQQATNTGRKRRRIHTKGN